MPTHHGKEGVVKIGANTVAEVTAFTIEEEAETADDSSMGDVARTHLVGLTSWRATITCWWDETDTNGQEAMTPGASVAFGGYAEGDSSGDNYASGTGSIVKRGQGVTIDGVTTRDFEIQGNGPLAWANLA